MQIFMQSATTDHAKAAGFGKVLDIDDGVFAHDGDRGPETGD